jgi:hypothetical protein
VGPRAFLGLERGDKAQSLPFFLIVSSLSWSGEGRSSWCWLGVGVGAKLESLKRICESLEEATKGSIYLQIIGDSSK